MSAECRYLRGAGDLGPACSCAGTACTLGFNDEAAGLHSLRKLREFAVAPREGSQVCIDRPGARWLVARNERLCELSEYAQHLSWRCDYRTRYGSCRCGLDDLTDLLGLQRVPPDDPEARAV